MIRLYSKSHNFATYNKHNNIIWWKENDYVKANMLFNQNMFF